MKLSIDSQRVKLYGWIGLAYLSLWVFGDLVSETGTFWKRVVNNIWLCSYLTVVNFLLFEYSMPFIRLQWKRLLAAPFLLAGYFILYSIVFYGWRNFGIYLGIYFELKKHPSIEAGIQYHLPYSMMSAFFFGVIRYTYDYRQLKAAAQQLRIEKQQAELSYLKSQTNPHFLFNTLNNIYSLSRDKSDLAPESILRLSKILRFMLYETGGEYIAIEQEIKIISDYIALEKLRYDESLRINFNHDVEDMHQALPPLLLIPLVENAFKHGASETRGRPYVDIHLSVNQRKLEFIVKNSCEKPDGDGPVVEHIGLSNLRRQLQLLYSDYSLSVHQSDTEFAATLKINLASHVKH